MEKTEWKGCVNHEEQLSVLRSVTEEEGGREAGGEGEGRQLLQNCQKILVQN